MSSQRQLKTKIRTVGNIRQITRAMEMVAATKMRKTQEVALRAGPYAK
jgi:F-type H+-transporting ATPase subunit gamma